MRNFETKDRKITLDRLDSFVSGRQVLDAEYMKAEYPDGTPKQISEVGVLASRIAEFAKTDNYDRGMEIAVELSNLCKTGEIELANDGAYVLDTKFGKIRFFRLVESYGKDMLQRMYFDTVTKKPHNHVIKLLARNKNVKFFDHVTGLTDIYHWQNDDVEGYVSSWMETDFGKGDDSKAYVIDPSLRLAMPRDAYYYLYASKTFNRISGEKIASDLKNPVIKQKMLAQNNLEYIFCRDELVKKLSNGQLGD